LCISIKFVNDTWYRTNETKAGKRKRCLALAISGTIKNYVKETQIQMLETKYDDDTGDLYVALGFGNKRAIVKMDSVQTTITEIKEV